MLLYCFRRRYSQHLCPQLATGSDMCHCAWYWFTSGTDLLTMLEHIAQFLTVRHARLITTYTVLLRHLSSTLKVESHSSCPPRPTEVCNVDESRVA